MPAPLALACQMRDRILFVIGTLDIGGAESQMVMLAKGLAARGWTVEVFALNCAGPLCDELEQYGIGVFGNNGRGVRFFARGLDALTGVFALMAHCGRTRPHVVHAFLPLTNFLGALIARITLVPVVVTSRRALSNHQDRYRWSKWLDNVANKLSTHVVANSQAVAADVARRDDYPRAAIAVIANGIDMPRFANSGINRASMRAALGLRNDEIALVNVANLIPYKGHRDLLAAFERIAAGWPMAKLFLVGGDRGILADLRSRAAQAGISNRVMFLGARDDIPELLSAMDIGVMASHEEGLPNALIEKLAAGLPVVATDVGGCAEVLSGMPNCHLASPGNPTSLSESLSTVLASLPEQNGQGERRRRQVSERYSADTMITRYELLYVEYEPG